MQVIEEHLIGVIPVYLVGALNAEVQRWRRITGEGDRYAVIVADLRRLRVPRVRARVPLAHERDGVTPQLAYQPLPVEQVGVEGRPVVEQQLGRRGPRRARPVGYHAEHVLQDVLLVGHQALQQLAVVRRVRGVLEDHHHNRGDRLADVVVAVLVARHGEREDVVAQGVHDVLVQAGREDRYRGGGQVRQVVDQVVLEEGQERAQTLQDRLPEGWNETDRNFGKFRWLLSS